MALGQVGARVEGDVYQGLFFWREAASLLIPGSRVACVELEHDAAAGVDDVAVFYEPPGVDAGGWLTTADFYQIKYHVDRRDQYCSEALIDPAFIKTKTSLLQRFHQAYERLAPNHQGFRLHLASNWRWSKGDPLAESLREFDGALPSAFFEAGPKSDLGKVREMWRDHLGLEPDAFARFAATLRLQLDYFYRRHFRDSVYDRLARVGLRVPTADATASPYDSLVQQFLMNGRQSFDAESLRNLCEREGLTEAAAEVPASSIPPAIAIRSFMRFAERIEEEADPYVCVVEHFDGRHPRFSTTWTSASAAVRSFLGGEKLHARLRASEHAVLLECHGSLALLAGHELSRNSGSLVFPIQKPARDLWKPSSSALQDASMGWDRRDAKLGLGPSVAVVLSVTHDILADVEAFIRQRNVPVGILVSLRPQGGVGPASIAGPDHAVSLASALATTLRTLRRDPKAAIHLFASAPNAFLFFLGQYREALGRLQVYEFDFDMARHCSYEASIQIPPRGSANAREDQDGTEV